MPLFGPKQSKEGKRRMEHKMTLAKSSPEPSYDLSDCELTEVPSGVYALCKVLQKEVLLLHSNLLSSLKGGGVLKDLCALRVLDLHQNRLSSVPDDIGELDTLQVLNLENNKLTSLPESVGRLQALQTLNCRENRLTDVHSAIGNLKSLRTLDLSRNRVSVLPKQLCRIKTLESLLVDVKQMVYPPAELCEGGTAEIMKALCAASGEEYTPPTHHLLPVLDAGPKSGATSPDTDKNLLIQQEYDRSLQESFLVYERLKEQKRREHVELEAQLQAGHQEQMVMFSQASQARQNIITVMAKEQDKMDGELTDLQNRKDQEKQRLVHTLQSAEQSAAELVRYLMETNEKARKTEALLEAMEKERIEMEETVSSLQQEHENLRKKEVLAAMSQMLAENYNFEHLRQQYEATRDAVARHAQHSVSDESDRIDVLLDGKQQNQAALVHRMAQEEEFQKKAFEALQLEKDMKHSRITGQIALIEQQLVQLTLVEMEKKALRMDMEQEVLCQKRTALTALLVQLLEEKQTREQELKKRLVEMERHRQEEQEDYWLILYQRLLDRKPQQLVNKEAQVDIDVLKLMNGVGAEDYIPVFARHHIFTMEQLSQMSNQDLQQIGMHEFGLRQEIVSAAKKWQEEFEGKKKVPDKQDRPEASAPVPEPTAEVPPTAPAAVPTAPARDTLARVITECVVCMEQNSSVLFLNCGHVCCCAGCAGNMEQCPLCRGDIVQRVILVSVE
ncbi:E3 ubiquitin-protein ligase LRSAM1-like [Branchiostoma floridae]|uniref:E3 ubiquitin-protein ligase LRSAM1-like n=1 Tax=Branchiostoma floridae TaxID=7739 RepID=A0A9J7MYX2_BRAFL|nr:E3 ubiquitin-protein ligase LRSAM1-like [Branchiostoma floridae]